MWKKIQILIAVIACFTSVSVMAETENLKAAAETNAKLGLAYLKRGMYAVSKDRLMDALRQGPDLAVVWYSMAFYLEKTNQPAAAEKDYLKAISVEPKSGSAKNNYGTFLCRAGRYQAGIAQFIAAVHEPEYLESAKAYENAGICSEMMRNKPQALYYYLKALDNNPNMPFSLLSVARLDYEKGDMDSATKYFENFKLLAMHGEPAALVQQYHDYVFKAPLDRQVVVSGNKQALPMPG